MTGGHPGAVEFGFEMAARCRKRALELIGGTKMVVTKERLFGWVVKGFDGLSNFMLERSNQEVLISEENVASIEQDIKRLDRVLNLRATPTNENCDHAIAAGLHFMSVFLHQLVFEMGFGTIPEMERDKLFQYLNNLKVAVTTFKKAG